MTLTDGFQIAAVSRMTGLSTDIIRAWERRYALVTPERSAAGVRLYSADDVSRLELAHAAVSLGHPIRRVAALSDDGIRSLIDTTAGTSSRPALQSTATAQTIAQILDAIREYDLVRAEAVLGSAALIFTPMDFILDVLAPFMHEVGTLWENGSLAIAQEHFASNLVRSLIGSMMRMRPPSTDEAMLFVTPPDELHEFGILFSACLASLVGFKAIVLGTGIPAKEVIAAARKIAPARIVAGVVRTTLQAGAAEFVGELRRALPAQVKICIGGQGASTLPVDALPPGVETVGSLAEFHHRIGRVAR
ncbi:MAG TPA: B12-binding domain-containing protein [Candidatus Baltobacteraceae bacterium]|nr:B12-binding domain-containing protein [Candidatus Baltobacteraceae bacterium]